MTIFKYIWEKFGISKRLREANDLSLFVSHPLFLGFSRRDRRKVWQVFDIKELDSGDILIEQGKPCRALYLLISGKIDLNYTDSSSKTIGWTIETPGQTIGEWSFIDSKPSLVSASVAVPSSVMLLKSANLNYFLNNNPRLGARFLLNLGRFVSFRLRQTNKKLTSNNGR